MEFQSPSLRGSGRFHSPPAFGGWGGLVSIPFIAGQWSLHGARGGRGLRGRVSIPFIAGQWSLLLSSLIKGTHKCVSIPFIAGQWSLRYVGEGRGGACAEFQSPSLRGSGRFELSKVETDAAARFNPLHCGAVVASRPWQETGPTHPSLFQSPSLRGSGRFRFAAPSSGTSGRGFQSPSLRGSGRFPRRRVRRMAGTSFNPLHCGAVVASARRRGCRVACHHVSIPFIAGQWSLLPPRRGGDPFAYQRFNPLHCGAVVASLPRTTPSSLFGVLLRKRRLPCDHIICTRLPF